jgi:hypothetical protein
MIDKINWNLTYLISKKRAACFFFFILLTTYKSPAQKRESAETSQFYKVISFDEKIDFGKIDDSVKWIISNSQDNSISEVSGNDINDYIFQNPGDYEINFKETKKHDEVCHHAMFPEKFRIKVAAVKLSYDFSQITFSKKLQKGSNTDLIVTVLAKVLTKDNSITKLPAPRMSVSGIGVVLIATPEEKEIVINNKVNFLKYKLSGTIDKETYLMFDFYDFNNQVQTYNLPQFIK